MKPILIAFVGLPRSGKSTIAKTLSKELNAPIVNRDNIRLALHGQRYASEAEPMTRAIYKIMIHALFLAGHGTVIADETNWSKEARNFIKDGPWETRFYEVSTSPEICKARALATGQPDLLSVIDEMHARRDPLTPEELRYERIIYAFSSNEDWLYVLGGTQLRRVAPPEWLEVEQCNVCRDAHLSWEAKLSWHKECHSLP